MFEVAGNIKCLLNIDIEKMKMMLCAEDLLLRKADVKRETHWENTLSSLVFAPGLIPFRLILRKMNR